MTAAMTVTEGAAAMSPPMPRRELARRLQGVEPVGAVWARRGRRPATYPVDAIFKAHRQWLAESEIRQSRKV